MATVSVSVLCSECGKTLRGTPAINGGWHVSKHLNPATRKSCWGARRTNHTKRNYA